MSRRAAAPAAVMLAVAVWGACGNRPSSGGAEAAEAHHSARSPSEVLRLAPEAVSEAGIEVGEAVEAPLEESFSAAGRVTWNDTNTHRVGAFVEGVIVESRALVGDRVESGQVLARIHSHEVHDAEANYWAARAEIERREAELEYAHQAYQRASRLHELKAGSLQKVQEAETALRAAESALERARAELQRAISHLRFLGLSPERMTHPPEQHPAEADHGKDETHLIEIKAPAAGTVVARHVSPGSVVTPSDTLYVLSGLSAMWIIAHVQEQDLPKVREGMAVRVRVRAYPDRAFPARVTFIGNELDPETRTVQVRCEAANPDGALKAEMYATVEFDAGSGAPAVLVPLTAVEELGGGNVVFVPEGESAFRPLPVALGREAGSRVEIVSGLRAGERIVIRGAFRLKSEMLRGELAEEH